MSALHAVAVYVVGFVVVSYLDHRWPLARDGSGPHFTWAVLWPIVALFAAAASPIVLAYYAHRGVGTLTRRR